MGLHCIPIPLKDAEKKVLESEAIRRCGSVYPNKEITCIHYTGYDQDYKGFLFEIDLDHGTHFFNTVIQVSDRNPILRRKAEFRVEGRNVDAVATFRPLVGEECFVVVRRGRANKASRKYISRITREKIRGLGYKVEKVVVV